MKKNSPGVWWLVLIATTAILFILSPSSVYKSQKEVVEIESDIIDAVDSIDGLYLIEGKIKDLKNG